jgi:exodeoxyribonuclease-3
VRLVTWNVNSLKVRLPRVEAWIDEVRPDVVALQETKLADDAFPALAFEALGYESVHFGQGRWNGVALLSRVGLANPRDNFADGIEPDHEARIVSATCGGVRVSSVYVPNGRSLDDDHYRYKLGWMARLRQHVEIEGSATGSTVVMGDFNIAPDDRDVWDTAAYEGATHVSGPERDSLQSLIDWGMVDLFRIHHEAGGLFSWWDYRDGAFHRGRGMRIDLVLGTAAVAERCSWAVVDRNSRKGEQPSDHAPVVVDLRD